MCVEKERLPSPAGAAEPGCGPDAVNPSALRLWPASMMLAGEPADREGPGPQGDGLKCVLYNQLVRLHIGVC